MTAGFRHIKYRVLGNKSLTRFASIIKTKFLTSEIGVNWWDLSAASTKQIHQSDLSSELRQMRSDKQPIFFLIRQNNLFSDFDDNQLHYNVIKTKS